MNSSENKSGCTDGFDPALLSSYLVDISGIDEADGVEAEKNLAKKGRAVIKQALKEHRTKNESKTIFHDFGLFVEMLRRRDQLTRDELAEKADIELSEVVRLETEPNYDISPRALYQLERCFRLKENTLGRLSGAIMSLNSEAQDRIVRYAAQAKHANHLNDQEQQILDEVIALLCREG